MDFIELLQMLISYNTTNNPSKNVYPDLEIIDFLSNIVNQWHPDIKTKIFKKGDYKSLYITTQIDKKCDVLFLGHLDVVPVSMGWKTDPFKLKVESGLAYGRGAKDCKGSIVSALIMLKKLCDENNKILSKLGFYFSTDEESGGQFGSKMFFDYANNNKILPRNVINVDGGPQIVHKRRAGFNVKIKLPPKLLTTVGKIETKKFETRVVIDDNRHSAYFTQGCDTHAVIFLSKFLFLNRECVIKDIKGSWIKGNVIPDDIIAEVIIQSENNHSGTKVVFDDYLTKILMRIKNIIHLDVRSKISSEFGISVNPNIVSYSQNDGTEVYFDVRVFLDSDDTDYLLDVFKERLGDLSNVATVVCPGTSGYFYTPLNTSLIKISSSVLDSFKLYSNPCEQEGASDARYASIYEIPVIDLGAKGGNIHGNNEFINLDSMKKFALIYEEIVTHLLNQNNILLND